MSLAPALHKLAGYTTPFMNKTPLLGDKADIGWDIFKPKTPPTPPGVPNPNDAMNAAQSQTDAMRMRRGMLANIYAGGSSSAPVVGKTTLG
jgi:hypothetical protein